MDLGISGLASGFDWRALIAQLTEVDRAPQRVLLSQQTVLQNRNIAYGSLISELGVLQNKVKALQSASLYGGRQVELDNFSAATASAAADTPVGSYAFAFSQLATAAAQQGGANIGASISPTNDVSALVLNAAPFATAVTAGNFTVNGATVTIATTDTLQEVFTKISTATGGAVTATYSTATDKITLASASPISLGSAGDTSNFLSVTKLTQNGTNSVASALALGVVKTGAVLASANFGTAITGTGEFKINGVSINYDAATDTLSDVVSRINNSAAGVTAQYDTVSDRLTLTNKTTGDVSVALQNVTGNFLTATKVLTAAGGTLVAGQDLKYTLNGGATLTSRSNTVTGADHGIAGLSVTARAGATSTTTPATVATGFPMLVAQFGGSGIQTRVRTTPPHNYQTGFAMKFATTGALPSQINAATVYYVRRIDANNFSLHPTAAGAVANTGAINFGVSPTYSGDNYSYQVDPINMPSSSSTAASVNVTVSSETEGVKTALAAFVEQYNKVQSLIASQTASTTDDKGKVTAGILAGDRDVEELSSRLRQLAYGSLTGLSGTVNRLGQLGYATNGNDDTLALGDSATLDDLLATNLPGIRDFFSHTTNGWATGFTSYLTKTAGEDGTLLARQTLLTTQATDIDKQVADLERLVQSRQNQLLASFLAMENAQAKTNQQLQFLQQRFGVA